jgi:hypothetical protein
VLAGRSFTAGDVGGPPLAPGNEALARRFCKDRDPLGERLKPDGGPNEPWFTVVGVRSYVVTRQSQEIGIRMALGAGRGAILLLSLKRGLSLAGIGLVGGVAGALLLSRLIRSLLFGISPNDPFTLVLVTTVMAIVATTACIVPVWRATRVDPLVVLRNS